MTRRTGPRRKRGADLSTASGPDATSGTLEPAGPSAPERLASEPAGGAPEPDEPRSPLASGESGVSHAPPVPSAETVPATCAELAKRAAAAALTVPGVVAVGGGSGPGVLTYGLPGEAVSGVRVTQDSGGADVEIHLTIRLVPIPLLASRVRHAIVRELSPTVHCRSIDVWVDSVEVTP